MVVSCWRDSGAESRLGLSWNGSVLAMSFRENSITISVSIGSVLVVVAFLYLPCLRKKFRS